MSGVKKFLSALSARLPLERTAIVVGGLAVFSAAACIVLLGLRLSSVISFTVPLQLVTSGWEQESLVAVWEARNGDPVYVSRWEIPFRWAVYNWLYYQTYTGIWTWIADLFALGDPWLPTITRLFTLAGAAVCAAAAWLIFRMSLGSSASNLKGIALGFTVLVAFGPLVGYWGMTTRPDVWALALEVLAVTVYWYLADRRPIIAILIFCVIAYAAWAFKQSSVTAVGALGMLMLVRRRWAGLLVLVAVMVAAWGTTLGIGSSIYRTSIFLSEYTSVLTFNHALGILTGSVPKTLPAIAGIAVIGYFVLANAAFRRQVCQDDMAVYALAGTGISLVLALLASRQPGAAENYYFVPQFFAALGTVAGLRIAATNNSASTLSMLGGQSIGWCLQSAAVLAVLAGLTGSTSVGHLHEAVMARKACIDPLPRPLFVNDHYLSLPWMTPDNPSFVLAFGYHADRLAGRKYRHDGIGGLITKGHFAALAFGHDPNGRYDGASLSGYELAGEPCAGLHLFRRAGLS